MSAIILPIPKRPLSRLGRQRGWLQHYEVEAARANQAIEAHLAPTQGRVAPPVVDSRNIRVLKYPVVMPHGSCETHRRYSSEYDALCAARILFADIRRRLTVLPCQRCKGWHVGKQGQAAR